MIVWEFSIKPYPSQEPGRQFQLTLEHSLHRGSALHARTATLFNRHKMNASNSAHLGSNTKAVPTPWGAAHTLDVKCPDKSVIVVTTSSHGGIGVNTSTHVIPEHFKSMCIIDGDWAWFEEDEASAAAILMFPDLFPKDQAAAEATLLNWYPAVYAAHYGRMPTASDSYRVRVSEVKERLKNHYTVEATWGDWAWNVPQGHLYVLGRRSSDGHQAGFLIPSVDYKSPIDEIVLDAYPRWEANRALLPVKSFRACPTQQHVEVA